MSKCKPSVFIGQPLRFNAVVISAFLAHEIVGSGCFVYGLVAGLAIRGLLGCIALLKVFGTHLCE